MDYTSTSHEEFEYTIVPPPQNSTYLLTADLTTTEVYCERFLTTDKTTHCLPEQTTAHHSGLIPLLEPENGNGAFLKVSRDSNKADVVSGSRKTLNCDKICQFLRCFGVREDVCSSVLGEITSFSSSRGVIEIKIWKIKTRVYKLLDISMEKSFTEMYFPNSIRLFKYNNSGSTKEEGCAICMDSYTPRSIVTKLTCDHDFHGICISKWLQINHQCPMCRFPISI